MEEAYRCSTLLLPKALDNALSKTILPLEPSGRNCRLPSNSTVVRFLGKMAAASIRRFAYGTFFEKRWQIATAPCGALDAELLVSDFPDPTTWQNFDCPKNYRFVADPFPNPVAEGVLAEGLRRSDRQGEILHLSSRQPTILCSGKGHFSYPATICIGPDCFLIPEISEWSSPRIFRLSPDSVKEVGRLRVEGSPQLIDPTLHRDSAGTIYLFANCNETGPGVLRLWVACNVFDTFSEHPLSPVCISPAGARMGGALIEGNGRLYRFGQDGARDYGDGLLLFSITELSERCYREEEVGRLQLSSVKGPHTLNFQGEKALFDFYRDRFTPLAGLGRLQSRLAKHRAKRT